MSTTTRSGPRRRTVLGTAAVALLTVAALAWWLLPQDEPSGGAGGPGGTDPTTRAAAGSPDGPPEEGAASGAPPSPGSLDPVPYQDVEPRTAGSLTSVADFGTGLSLRVTRFETVRSDARRPGEISAPAVRVTLRADNDSARPIPVEGLVVTADYGPERTPAISVTEPGGRPFAGELAPGASMRGVYLFNVPEPARDQVRLTTSYTGAAPTLVLAGSVTRARAALDSGRGSR